MSWWDRSSRPPAPARLDLVPGAGTLALKAAYGTEKLRRAVEVSAEIASVAWTATSDPVDRLEAFRFASRGKSSW
jgi:hypothetical protein